MISLVQDVGPRRVLVALRCASACCDCMCSTQACWAAANGVQSNSRKRMAIMSTLRAAGFLHALSGPVRHCDRHANSHTGDDMIHGFITFISLTMVQQAKQVCYRPFQCCGSLCCKAEHGHHRQPAMFDFLHLHSHQLSEPDTTTCEHPNKSTHQQVKGLDIARHGNTQCTACSP